MAGAPKLNSKKHGIFILLLLFIFVLLLFFYLNEQKQNKLLTFAMLDIGQGDALFIESPTGTQVLIDAGPQGRVLSQLSRVMPLFDSSIDAIIITNPDADHIGGFEDVLKNYKVSREFEPGTFNDSKTYLNLENQIRDKGVTKIIAKKGMRLNLGGGAIIDILFPDRDVSDWTTNDGSIVARLTYGETSMMLTGDATAETERIILQSYPKEFLDSDILKVGHHGSHTSSSPAFVEAVSPEYAVISDGKHNKYGHPHKETIDTLSTFGAKVLRTDELGTIVFKCDRIGACVIKN